MDKDSKIKTIEKLIGKEIPVVEKIQISSLGIEYQNNTIYGLSLNHCELKSVPDPIKDLKLLQHLDLAHNNISEIPDWIDELSNLRFLILNNNKIKELPRSIGNFKNLEVLHILNNPIERLPMSFRNYADIYSKFRELSIRRYGLHVHTIDTIQMLRNRGVKIIEPKSE